MDFSIVICYIGTVLSFYNIFSTVDGVPASPKYKKVLIYSPFTQPSNGWREQYGCLYTCDPTKENEVDAILFQRDYHKTYLPKRRNDQVWIYYLQESPYTIKSYIDMKEHHMEFNWTVTYRLDSTIPTPYGMSFPLPVPARLSQEEVNVAAQKTRKVAWLVSHCHVNNMRLEYANELKRYIDVDIFGTCGDLECANGKTNRSCVAMLRNYKFYLAFENTNCKDYITEKLWRNSYGNGIVPIVMGAPKESYQQVAPPYSFIHVDDFNSPAELADYLHMLDKNDTLYDEYFVWRRTHRIGKPLAALNQICKKLNEDVGQVSWFSDFYQWWSNDNVCVLPTSQNPYASWRLTNYTDTTSYKYIHKQENT